MGVGYYQPVVQWSIGNFITASGISLWGLLAPIGAVSMLAAAMPRPARSLVRLRPGRRQATRPRTSTRCGS